MTAARPRPVALALAGLVLAGCTNGGGTSPTPSPSALPLPSLRAVDPRATVRPRAVPWTNAAATGERALDVYYVASADTCRGLANVRVAETAATVTVTVYEAGLPGAPDTCSTVGFLARVRVPLRAPLARRALLDGAPPSPEPRPLRP
jgi:hypothetical protein